MTTQTMVGQVGRKWHRTIDGAVYCSGVRRQSRATKIRPAEDVAAESRCAICAGGTGGRAPAASTQQDPEEARRVRLAVASDYLASYERLLEENRDNPQAVADLTPQVEKYRAEVAELGGAAR
jgi:hypothetical protein